MHRLRCVGLFLGALLVVAGVTRSAHAADYGDASSPPPAASVQTIKACLLSAASLHHVSPVLLYVLLRVEGGSLGMVSGNSNDTVDIGPMQINQIWLPRLAQRWHSSIAATFEATRDNVCANFEAGAWILEQGMKETGDFWSGVAYYHSHSPGPKQAYLRQVLKQLLAVSPTSRAHQQMP